MIFLVVPIGLVQAPHDLPVDRGIARNRDDHAILRDDIAAFGLDRELFRTQMRPPIRPVPARRSARGASPKMHSTFRTFDLVLRQFRLSNDSNFYQRAGRPKTP